MRRLISLSLIGIFIFLFVSGNFSVLALPGCRSEVILPDYVYKNIGQEKKSWIVFRPVRKILTKIPVIALTFDDGPKPHLAEEVLDILNFYSVKATFFVVGKCAQQNPQIVERMIKEGHEVGNHTFNHQRLKFLSEEEIATELKSASEIIKKITGGLPSLFRPPGGQFSQKILRIAAKNNLKGIGWSVNARDYVSEDGETLEIKPLALAQRIIQECRGGDIILMHNGGTLIRDTLPLLIKELKLKKFQFVRVGQLLKLGKK